MCAVVKNNYYHFVTVRFYIHYLLYYKLKPSVSQEKQINGFSFSVKLCQYFLYIFTNSRPAVKYAAFFGGFCQKLSTELIFLFINTINIL